MLGALVAVNALGSATVADGPHFWAAPFEIDSEFGGLGPAPGAPPDIAPIKGGLSVNTTIGIVATDADLTQAQCTRLAIAAQDGLARALVPSHTPLDGDLVFAAATGTLPLTDPVAGMLWLGHAASLCMARAIARAVYEATPEHGDMKPSWHMRFG